MSCEVPLTSVFVLTTASHYMTDSTDIQAYRVPWKHLDADSYANNFNIYVTSTE